MNRMIPIRRAATVIEVAICIMILGVALPTLVRAFADASWQSIRPVNCLVAANLAIDKMEELVATRYSGPSGYSQVVAEAAAPVSGFAAYSRAVTVTFVDALMNAVGSDQGYKKVRVTVTWNGGADSWVIERVFANFGT